LPWTTCSAGTKLTGASSTSAGACVACEPGTFRLDSSHRFTKCVACSTSGTSCAAGQKQVGCGGSTAGSCAACSINEYQLTASRATSCQDCKSCAAGFKLAQCGVAQGPGSCLACGPDTYLASAGTHYIRSCTACDSCSPGFKRVGCAGNSAGSCVACAGDEFQLLSVGIGSQLPHLMPLS